LSLSLCWSEKSSRVSSFKKHSPMERPMKRLILFLVLLLTTVIDVSAQQTSGTYIAYKYSQRLGTERFSITTDTGGALKADATVEIIGQPEVKVSTRASSKTPISFSEEARGSSLFSADYSPAGLKLRVPGRADIEAKTQATVVLENLIWHHYILLLSQYDGLKGGPQDFVGSLPSQAKDVPIKVERQDSSSFTAAGR